MDFWIACTGYDFVTLTGKKYKSVNLYLQGDLDETKMPDFVEMIKSVELVKVIAKSGRLSWNSSGILSVSGVCGGLSRLFIEMYGSMTKTLYIGSGDDANRLYAHAHKLQSSKKLVVDGHISINSLANLCSKLKIDRLKLCEGIGAAGGMVVWIQLNTCLLMIGVPT